MSVPIIWTNAINVLVNTNSLTKNGGSGSAWDAGASSSQVFNGDVSVSFTVSETNKYRMIGLSHNDIDQNYTSIEFAIYPSADDRVYIYENGTQKYGPYGYYSTSTVFTIERIGTTILYKWDGTTFYKSTVSSSNSLIVDTSLYSTGATITNVVYNIPIILNTANASADCDNGSGYTASKACDLDNSTHWGSTSGVEPPHWWKYDFGNGNEQIIIAIDITPYSDGYGGGVKDFTIDGSNDNSNWTTLYTGLHDNSGTTVKYTFSNTTAYRYYRIYLSSRWRGIYEKNAITEVTMFISPNESLTISESLTLDDLWVLQPNPDNQSLSDSLILDDTWDIIRSLEPLDISDTLTLDDSWTLQVNPDNQSIDDTLILSDNWQLLTNPEQQLVNDDLILSDNWVTSLLGTFNIPIHLDLRWLATIKINIQTSFSWLLAKSINTDFRWLGKIKKSISTDFRWLKQSYTTLVPINYSNIQIFINGTDVLLGNDVDIETGNIVHTIGQISIASFVLTRRHDDLDRTHLGVASQITNQNPIQIYISGNLEFDGYISTLNANSETETIAVTATMEQPLDNRHTIELPLPSLNEKLHLYHCLVNSIQIDNPKEDTRAVIVGNNGRYWNGSNWIFYIENALTFTTDIDAQNYIDIYIDLSVNKIFESKQPSVTSREKNPQYYKGIKVNLGTEIIQQIDKWKLLEYIVNWTSPPGTPEIDRVVPGKGYYANKIEKGTFIAKPNYTYFWAVMAKNVITGRENVFSEYIGTSLASTTTDLWSLNGVTPMYQKIKDNLETELGYYYVGSAPYKEISTKNGVLFPKEKWQDRNDGLYNVLDVSYNYVDYAKLVANLEYQKLKNVAGNILPITSSNLEITFDAYYYYNIKLLTRINVTNTTISDIYKNLNGFPISVKTININFKTMKISLTTDNKLSQKEIDEIDNQMPDDESSLYVTPEIARLVYRKFDLKTWSHVS